MTYILPEPRSIGIVGLAGDPVHFGHLRMGESSLKYVDEVWFMLCNYHMYGKNMTAPEHRIAMLNIALETTLPESYKRGKVKVCDFEIANNLKMPTYEVLKELQSFYGNNYKFSVIIGQDNANGIDRWKYSEEIRQDYRFIVFPRGNVSSQLWYQTGDHYFAALETITENYLFLSSTKIRDILLSSESELEPGLTKFIPFDVLKYIKENNLYKE